MFNVDLRLLGSCIKPKTAEGRIRRYKATAAAGLSCNHQSEVQVESAKLQELYNYFVYLACRSIFCKVSPLTGRK